MEENSRQQGAAPVESSWTNRQAAEACRRMAEDAQQVGRDSESWGRAAWFFDMAWKKEGGGDVEGANEQRRHAASILIGAGLTVETALGYDNDWERAGVVDQWMVMVARCTVTAMQLRQNADDCTALGAAQATVWYGAAAAMERAARAWSDRESVSGASWERAADQSLRRAGLPVAWDHRDKVVPMPGESPIIGGQVPGPVMHDASR